MNEIQRILDEQRIEKKVGTELLALEEKMKKFIDGKEEKIENDNDNEALMAKLKQSLEKSKLLYESACKKLITLEGKFELLWTDDTFRYAFDFILDKALLTPQPGFMNQNNLATELELKSKIRKNEIKRAASIREHLQKLNGAANSIAEHLKTMNMMDPVHEQFEMMKWRVKGMRTEIIDKTASTVNNSDTTINSILDKIEEYRENQILETNLVESKAFVKSVKRLKERLRGTMENEDGRWKMRLGPGYHQPIIIEMPSDNPMPSQKPSTTTTPISPSKTKSNAKEIPMLPEHILERSRQHYYYTAETDRHGKLILENDEKKAKVYQTIFKAEGNEFLTTKYVNMLELTHRYLLKRPAEGMDEVLPKTLYMEAMEYLEI